MMRRTTIYLLLILCGTIVQAQDPPDISLIFYLDENSESGTLVGSVNASDPDGNQVSFSITSGNELNGFSIDSESGDLTVNDETALDFESTPVFDLMVEADDGNGGMTTASITINLNDIDEDVLAVRENKGEMADVFPNPFVQQLYVELGSVAIKDPQVELFTMEGKSIPIQYSISSSGKIRMELKKARRGVYLLRVSDNNSVLVFQRVISR